MNRATGGCTWHFEGDDVLQQARVLGLLGQGVGAQRELVLLQTRHAEGGGQAVGAVAHGLRRGELCHRGKLQGAEGGTGT